MLTGWIAFVDTNQSGNRDAGEVVLLQHEAMNAQITAQCVGGSVFRHLPA